MNIRVARRSMPRLARMFALFWCCSASAASNYAECILDQMPGTANNQVAYFIIAECEKKFPSGLVGVEPYSWKFKYANGRECATDKAKNTQSQIAAAQITVACFKLYGQLESNTR